MAFNAGRDLIAALDAMVAGSRWGQVAVNHLRERVNMTHVVLSLPAIVIAAIVVGIPFNWLLGGTRSALQRIAIALVSVPATVVLAVALFTFNALVPDSYAALLIERLGTPDEIVGCADRMRSRSWLCSTCRSVTTTIEPLRCPAPCTKCGGIFFETVETPPQ